MNKISQEIRCTIVTVNKCVEVTEGVEVRKGIGLGRWTLRENEVDSSGSTKTIQKGPESRPTLIEK